MATQFLQDADTQRVMLRLSKEYPGDLGILMPLMLNLLQLKPGLAFFMTVDEPHAYLRGDILEVRASTSFCSHDSWYVFMSFQEKRDCCVNRNVPFTRQVMWVCLPLASDVSPRMHEWCLFVIWP